MDRPDDELDRGGSLILDIGVWLCVLGALFVALVMFVPVAYVLAGARGEFTILGVKALADPGAPAIAGEVAMGLAMLGYAVYLVHACTGVAILSRPARDDAESPEPPQARVLWPPGPAPGSGRAAGDELLRVDGDAYAVSFTHDGALVTVGAGGMRLWDVRGARELLHVSDATGHVAALSIDGRHVAIGRGSFGIVIRSLPDGDERTLVHRGSAWKRGAGGVSAIVFSADGRRLATGGDPDTRVWSVADGGELLRIPTGPTEFYGLSIAFSPDGRYLATSTTDRVVEIWDSSDGRRVQRLDHRPHVYGRVATAVAFSADSRRLATLCADDSAWIWDVERGSLLLELSPPSRRPPCFDARTLAWDPDGTRLFVPGSDGIVRARDAAGGLELFCVEHGAPPERPRGTRWSGIDAVFGVSSGASAVAVSPDGTLLATGGADGTVRVRVLA